MTDVLLQHTANGGEITFEQGLLVMSPTGLETAAYLSLFGGNERDSGLASTEKLQWWGNLGERDAARQYRSETHYLLRSLALIPANLRRFEDAAKRDLAWMVSSVATAVTATATMPALDTVRLVVGIVIGDETISFVFARSKSST
jgi:phage gp46-like protein